MRTNRGHVAVIALFVVLAGCSAKTKASSSATTVTGGSASSATSTSTSVAQAAAVWQAAGLKPVSPPSAVGGEVFVTTQLPDKRLQGVALQAATGKVLWKHVSTVANRIGGMGLEAPVAVQGHNGLVAVQLESTGGQIAAGAPYAYVGRDARSGDRLWSHPVAGTIGAYACGTVVCLEVESTDASSFIAVDPDTGATAWSYTGAGPMDLLAESGGQAVVLTLSTPSETVALDTSTGDVKWTYDNSKALGTGTSSDGGWQGWTTGGNLVEYLGSYNGSPSGMFALGLSTGDLAWARTGIAPPIEWTIDVDATQPAASDQALGAVPPVIERSKETATTWDVSALEGIDPATGRATWNRALSLHYTRSGTNPLGVLSEDGKTAWIRDPQTGTPIGTNLETGVPVAATGTAWQMTQPDASVKLSGSNEFVAPNRLSQVRLPSLKSAGPGTPPAFLSARTGNTVAWIGQDGLLHGAPAT